MTISLDGALGVYSTGNVETANYFIGNGFYLSGIPAGYTDADVEALLASGNIANITVMAGDIIPATPNTYSLGNATHPWQDLWVSSSTIYINSIPLSVNSNADLLVNGLPVVVSSNTSPPQSANISTTAAVNAGNVVIANTNPAGGIVFPDGTFQSTAAVTTYGNANVAAYLSSGTLASNVTTTASLNGSSLFTANVNIAGATIGSPDATLTIDPHQDGLPTTGTVSILGNLQVTGNLTYNDVSTAITSNLLWQAANNASSNTLASGGGLAVGPTGGSYATWTYDSVTNRWISNLGAAFTGAVTATSFAGNGSTLSGITGANVTGTVASATTATTALHANIADVANVALSVAGANVTGQVANALVSGTVYEAAQPNITSVGTLTGLTSTGNISTTGNVSGGYLFGNGALITGLPAGYSDTDVANYLSSGTVNTNIITTANVTGNYLLGNGALITGLPAGYNNTDVANYLSGGTVNTNIITSANVTGAYFIGNGSTLSSITGANVTGTVPSATDAVTAGTVTTNAQPNITSVGILSSLNSGAISSSGTVTGVNFIGSGNTLSNLTGANVTGSVANATQANTALHSNIADVANVAYSVAGANVTGQVANALVSGTVYTAAQPNITSVGTLTSLNTGVISSSGTVTGVNFIGSGNTLTDITGANVTGQVANALVAGTVYANAQPNITSVGTLGNLAVASNISTGNISATGNVVASLFIGNFQGNISGNIVVPGANTDVLYNNNGNAGADAGFTYNSATQTITVAGRVVGAHIAGEGGNISNITGANVTGQVGNALVSGTVYTAAQPNITSVGTLTSLNSGAISSSGTVTGVNFIGSGNTLSNLTGANVTGQVANALVSGTVYTSAQPNITSVGTLSSLNSGAISSSGTVTGVNFIGSGNTLSNITGANVTGQVANALVSGTVYTAAQPNITSVGVLTSLSSTGTVTADALSTGASNLYISNTTIATTSQTITIDPKADGSQAGNVVVLGNLSVTGNLLYNDVTTAVTSNLVWEAANNAATAAAASGGGLAVGPAGAPYASWLYSQPANTWISNISIAAQGSASIVGSVTGLNFIGSGNTLTNLTGANVTGQVANALVSGTVYTNAQPNITSVGTLSSLNSGAISSSGTVTGVNFIGSGNTLANITGANVTGQVANALVSGTVYTAAQPNITSVGTLTSLNSGAISSSGTVTGVNFIGSGNTLSNLTGANVTGQVANALVSGTVYTAAQPNITSVGTLTSLNTGAVSSSGTVTGVNFIGSGNTLANITGANVTGQVANALVAGTVYTAAQPNITSLGNLTAVSASGVISTTGNISGNYILGNGSLLTNLPTANIIANGNSNVVIATSGGNVEFNVAGQGAGSINQDSAHYGKGSGIQGPGTDTVGLGSYAGQSFQQAGAIAIGAVAAYNGQGSNAIAIGRYAAQTSQGTEAVAVGYNSASTNQGAKSIAIGSGAGFSSPGANSVIIGASATGGVNSIVLNATGGYFTGGANGFSVTPVRNDTGNTSNVITYNTSTKELTYASTISLSGNITTAGTLYTGAPLTPLPNTVASFGANVDSYAQINFQNLSNGSNAEIALVVTADNGNDTVNYGDFGIVNSSYDPLTPTNSLGNIIGPADTFLYAQGNSAATSQSGGNLAIGATTIGKSVKIFAGGNTASNIVAIFNGNTVAIGPGVANNQSSGAIAIGSATGNNQGTGAIAIGTAAAANAQAANSIILNATGTPVTVANQGLYAAPVRGVSMSPYNTAFYNNVTNEITYGLPIFTKDLLTLAVNANISVTTANSAIAPQQVSFTTSTVTYTQATGIITLNANKTYRLAAAMIDNGVVTSNFPMTFMWSSNNSPISANTLGYAAVNGSVQPAPVEVYVQTGNVTAGVKLAPTATPTSGLVCAGSWLVVEEVGLSALTTDLYLSGNITANRLGGTVSGSAMTVNNYKETVYPLTYAATVTPDPSLGSFQTITLTGNVTINNFGGTPQAGQSMMIKIKQDATGNRTLTSTMLFAGGNKTLSTTANAIDMMYVFFDGVSYYATLNKAFQ